jgi:hypothetical protein
VSEHRWRKAFKVVHVEREATMTRLLNTAFPATCRREWAIFFVCHASLWM